MHSNLEEFSSAGEEMSGEKSWGSGSTDDPASEGVEAVRCRLETTLQHVPSDLSRGSLGYVLISSHDLAAFVERGVGPEHRQQDVNEMPKLWLAGEGPRLRGDLTGRSCLGIIRCEAPTEGTDSIARARWAW